MGSLLQQHGDFLVLVVLGPDVDPRLQAVVFTRIVC